MTFTSSKKVVAAVVGFGLALSIFAAVGVSTASAQAMTLSQLVDLFISLGIISSDKAAAAKSAVASSASSMVYSKDLTVGSSGSEVSALQAKLGVSPASGYFGSVTKAAVMKYQSENSLPSTGFVGPLTRAKLNGSATVSTPSTSGSVTVVNSGIEGTLSVAEESVSNSSVREGDVMKPLLGINLEAKLSDISIQRIKLDLGTTTAFYTKVYKTLYVVDASGKVLAQADLNSNTVTKNGTQYELTFGGLNYVVQKDQEKILTIKGDLYASIKDADKGNKTIQVVQNGVRGVDGAGIDQYGPSSAFGETIAVGTALVDAATLTLSTNSSNVKATDIVAYKGSNNDELVDETDLPTVLVFDLRAEKDNLLMTDLTATIAKTGTGAATATRAYLYSGSTQIDSASINGATGVVLFDGIDVSIAKDVVKTFSIKVDLKTANATASNITASVAAAGVVSENSVGSSVSASGSATGETFVVRNVGPVITLNSKTISREGSNQSGTTLATSSIVAKFSVKLEAVGSNLYFGNQATTSLARLFLFSTYNSSGTAVAANAASTTGFAIPSTGVVTDAATVGANSFMLQKGNSVTLSDVEVRLDGKDVTGAVLAGTWSVGIDAIRWSTTGISTPNSSTFMAGKSEWRTPTQTP